MPKFDPPRATTVISGVNLLLSLLIFVYYMGSDHQRLNTIEAKVQQTDRSIEKINDLGTAARLNNLERTMGNIESMLRELLLRDAGKVR